MKITAISDRLDLTLQDALAWTGGLAPRTLLVFDVHLDPVEGQTYYLGFDAVTVSVVAGAGETRDSLAIDLAAAIEAITGYAGAKLVGEPAFSLARDDAGALSLVATSRGMALRPRTIQDYQLLDLLVVAKQLADGYCCNPFAEVDDLGEIIIGSEVIIPEAVRVGVLQIVDWLTADKAQAGGAVGPIKRRKVGDVDVTYATQEEAAPRAGGLSATARNTLQAYRLMPGSKGPLRPAPLEAGLGGMAAVAAAEAVGGEEKL